jgi:hypothetical protein
MVSSLIKKVGGVMKKIIRASALFLSLGFVSAAALAQNCPYDPRCLNNPYGAGNQYKPDGLMNPYSRNGSPYSNEGWTNPYATNAPKIYDQQGTYRGKLSSNPYDPDSISNPYGRYGNPYSAESPNNSFGAGNPYAPPLLIVPNQ